MKLMGSTLLLRRPRDGHGGRRFYVFFRHFGRLSNWAGIPIFHSRLYPDIPVDFNTKLRDSPGKIRAVRCASGIRLAILTVFSLSY
jgi:hypothetical protein